ncbi:MAG: sigma 54-interacting transcriptional regulator, partial [Acidobacteriota bacterium]
IFESLSGLWRVAARRERPPRRPPIPPPEPLPLPEPATREAAMQRLYDGAAKVARGDISVLILGETGTGKEVLARWLHGSSRRADGPFMALNCAALPAELLEAELFGVERGVATGVEARPGKLELAAGGTLFLDEVGDAPLSLQAKLLRVLQERTLYRLGAARATPIDVRVLAATHHDPEGQVEAGALRLDLYHRLADWTARVPPLRRRRTDLPQLAGYFLRKAAKKLERPVRGISQGALSALLAYHWPGNIRELKQEMERAALLLGPGELLDRPRLSPQIRDARPSKPTKKLERALRDAERRFIRAALDREGGDRAKAAERLHISPATFYRRLKALDITVDKA